METVYYYKREDGTWVFSLQGYTGERRTIVKNESGGAQYLRLLVHTNKEMQRLYPDIPREYEDIQRLFFSPSYWKDRTWQQEYIGL